jgi:hypothetical protein
MADMVKIKDVFRFIPSTVRIIGTFFLAGTRRSQMADACFYSLDLALLFPLALADA